VDEEVEVTEVLGVVREAHPEVEEVEGVAREEEWGLVRACQRNN